MERYRITTLATALIAFGCAAMPMNSIRVSNDRAAQQRVWRIGEYLVETAARSGQRAEVEWRFGVIDEWTFGASASYDGMIAIDATFVSQLHTDELACVLGHEIGHVVQQHSRRGNTTSAVSGGLVLGGTIATIPFAPWWVPIAVFFGGDAIRDVGVAAYSRAREEEADAFAVWLSVASGYPPDACVRALERTKQVWPHRQSWISATLSATHPTYEDRIAFVRAEATKYAR